MNQNKVHIIDDDEEETNIFPVIDTITDHKKTTELITPISKPIVKNIETEPNRIQMRPQVSIPVQRELSSRIRNAPNRLNL